MFGVSKACTFARPDYGQMHQELRRKGVTLMLLWQEYGAQIGDEHCEQSALKALCYSQFSENYRQFAKRLKRSMRQVHRAGQKMFIDYAGLAGQRFPASVTRRVCCLGRTSGS